MRVRAVEERKERVQKIKEKKEEFKQLLDDVVSSSRFVFSNINIFPRNFCLLSICLFIKKNTSLSYDKYTKGRK